MVMPADTGSRSAALRDKDCGYVSNLLGRKEVEMRERRKLEMSDTNISWEDEIIFKFHWAPRKFASSQTKQKIPHPGSDGSSLFTIIHFGCLCLKI